MWKLFKIWGRSKTVLLRGTRAECERRATELRGRLKFGQALLLATQADKVHRAWFPVRICP